MHVVRESTCRGKSRGSEPEPALSIGVKSVDWPRSHANLLVADSSSALHEGVGRMGEAGIFMSQKSIVGVPHMYIGPSDCSVCCPFNLLRGGFRLGALADDISVLRRGAALSSTSSALSPSGSSSTSSSASSTSTTISCQVRWSDSMLPTASSTTSSTQATTT